MTDRKKVIKGLEYCITHYNCRDNRKSDCPYLDLCEPIKDATGNTLMRDALALLKEQEAVTYKVVKAGEKSYPFYDLVCTGCGNKTGMRMDWKYCPGCGRSVKWE